jgi:hypothetical protein
MARDRLDGERGFRELGDRCTPAIERDGVEPDGIGIRELCARCGA